MDVKILKEEINELPVEIFTGEIIVVDEPQKIRPAIDELLKYTVLGFDTETKPSFKRGISHTVGLIQISTDDVCYLFRLNKIGFPEELDEIFCNPDIKKIGLSLRDDFAAIRKRSDKRPLNFVDLQQYVLKFGIEDASLQKIYAIIFRKKISKNQRLSNWESPELTSAQQMYAALDAWATLRIYKYLNNLDLNGKVDYKTQA